MMKKTRKRTEIEKQLRGLIDYFHQIQQKGSLKKYQHIKMAIKELLYGCQQNDCLPSIRAISKALGAAPVPVQRAITELVAENILYVKNGIGVFVKNVPERFSTRFTGHDTSCKVNDLDFLFYDSSDVNRATMLRIVEKFRQDHPNSPAINLTFEKDNDIKPDIMVQIGTADRSLDLSDFASHEVKRGNLTLLGKYSAVLAYSSYYLFYNEELLEKTGIEKPSYTKFSEQEEYIRHVRSVLAGKDVLGPLSWNRPLCFLGQHTYEILKFLKGTEKKDSDSGKRTLELLSKIMNYYCLFLYEGKKLDNAKRSAFWYFLNGKAPLFAGHTNCLTQFRQYEWTDLKWDAYPIFAYDDTLVLQPFYIRVDGNTRLPVECVKLLMYLQAQTTQMEFYNQGYITVQRKGKYIDENPVHSKAAQESFSGFVEESVDNHLFEHILDSELIECGIYNKDIKETFENILSYSRGYIRNFAGQKIG